MLACSSLIASDMPRRIGQDTEDRNFGPVLLESAGVTDLLTPCMDHGWCFGYTCQKRLSTYWMTVAADQVRRNGSDFPLLLTALLISPY